MRIALILACIAICLPLRVTAMESAFVSLRTHAEVDRLDVRLADVADIVARDPSIVNGLSYLTVATLPTLAVEVPLSQASVAAAVQERAPAFAIVWGSNREVLIRGRSQRIALDAGIDEAGGALVRQLGRSGRIAARVVAGGEAIDVPVGRVEVRPDFDAASRSGGNIEVPLNIDVDGIRVATRMVRFEMLAGFGSGEEPPRGDTGGVRSGNRESAPQTRQATRPSPASPKRNLDASVKGARKEALTGPPSVERDQAVRIVIDAGAVRIESQGVALADARVGEAVKVLRTKSGTELLGRAVDRGVVLVGSE